MSKPRRRSASEAFNLYTDETGTQYWRLIRAISLERGMKLCADGAAGPVYKQLTGELDGFKMLPRKQQNEISTDSTPAAISASESQLNACGISKTIMLPVDDARRFMRIDPEGRKLLGPEDAVERAINKVRSYASVNPLRAVPRTAAEIRAAYLNSPNFSGV